MGFLAEWAQKIFLPLKSEKILRKFSYPPITTIPMRFQVDKWVMGMAPTAPPHTPCPLYPLHPMMGKYIIFVEGKATILPHLVMLLK